MVAARAMEEEERAARVVRAVVKYILAVVGIILYWGSYEKCWS